MKGQENFRQNTEASGPEAETSGREAGDFEKETKDCLRRSGILLAGSDYTCSRMREKLLSYGFAEDVVGKTLEDLQSAHYLDDVRFAENFVRAHREDRSRRRIRMDLESRGVPPEIISEVLDRDREEHGGGAEIRQIRRLMEKRKFDPEDATWEERGRMQAFLYRKGYDAVSVRIAMSSAIGTDTLDSGQFSV